MISCTEFIPAYSELFKFLEQKGGKAEVIRFWENLSDAFLNNLRELAAQKGLAGCFEYWSHTLSEEAADFKMMLDEENQVFTIEMRKCPSRGRLLERKDIEPYHVYCEHCDLLYRRVLEPLGFEYNIDLSNCDKAACKLVVRTNVRK
ncbi:MAG: hypothetical protein A2Y12_10470 [Planctomycetes bacterium GWF2_42_9]|nr:MAG: hypothetical protein A2Y12_10470 [Planctomycetes bacterium GWF2_42_9]